VASAVILAGSICALGYLVWRAPSPAIGLLVGLSVAGPCGWALASARVHPPSPRGLLLFGVDHSWSLLNTAAGAAFLALNLIAGHRLDRARSRHSGRIDNFTRGVYLHGWHEAWSYRADAASRQDQR
jgi:hypothetical protein